MKDSTFADRHPQIAETHIPPQDRILLESIRQWVFKYTGLHYSPGKKGILYSRLQSLCWRLGIRDIAELDQLLNQNGSDWLASEVARVVTTNYTFFFREKETFDFLRDYILPDLSRFTDWRIWSAASSSGEEAISVAIQIMESIGQEKALKKASILGTDLNYFMIEQAERGLYPDHSLDVISKDLIYKYFELADSKNYHSGPSVRQMCTFRRMNLMSKPWLFKRPFHLILCRNIFYYFKKNEQFELIERLYDATIPGGWLLTSITETFHPMPIRWKQITTGVWKKNP